MIRKILIVFLPLILIIYGFSSAKAAYYYKDVKGHWAENDIYMLLLDDIVKGYEDETFRPNNNMTRAELVTIINRMLGNSELFEDSIPDIKETDWFYEEIKKGMASRNN